MPCSRLPFAGTIKGASMLDPGGLGPINRSHQVLSMQLHVQERSAEDALGGSLLRLVGSESQIDLLRRELSGFSHRCRNVLNGLKMSLFLVKRESQRPLPSWWAEVEEEYQAIETLFDQLQAIYRPLALTPVHASFGSLVRDRRRFWSESFEGAGRTLEIVPPEQEVAGELDPMCLGAALDTFVGWRARTMRSDCVARLAWLASNGTLEVVWLETRLNSEARDAPRRSCGAGQGTAPGTIASLALPLLARVITAHQGTLERNEGCEFRVMMCWPLSQGSAASP